MPVSIGSSSSSLSWVASSSASLPSSFGSHRPRGISKLSLSRGMSQRCHLRQLSNATTEGIFHNLPVDYQGHSRKVVLGKQKFSKRKLILFATSQDHSSIDEPNSDSLELETQPENAEDILPGNSFPTQFEASEGKPGFISFYGRPYRRKDEIIVAGSSSKHQSRFLWFVGPTVLVASFIFPSLYLRRILSTVFEDSLLTDFLILFFTEALFYCGVAVFLLLIDRSQRPLDDQSSFSKGNDLHTPKLVYRISSVATLVLSLIIPMVTMGFVWPWTGPAASATLAPYLVGIVVQFAFEQYARYLKSPSWPVIPIIFQIYRLHQLNRAAQLVTALSLTVRGAETTSHTLAISSSLGTLLNVVQFLGVVCIWSLASFLMRFLPSVSVRTDCEAS